MVPRTSETSDRGPQTEAIEKVVAHKHAVEDVRLERRSSRDLKTAGHSGDQIREHVILLAEVFVVLPRVEVEARIAWVLEHHLDELFGLAHRK